MRLQAIVTLATALASLILLAACAQPAAQPVDKAQPAKEAQTAKAAQPAAKIGSWRLAGHTPLKDHAGEASAKFAELVGQRTNGALSITFYPSDVLMQTAELVAATMKGDLDMANSTTTYDTSAVSVLGGLDLPFAGLKVEQWETALSQTGEVRAIAEKAYEAAGLKLLSIYPLAEQGFVTRQKPILRLEDFKGVKMRVVGTQMAQSLALLGASPVSLSGGEAVEALRTGIVDGAQVPTTTPAARKYGEFTKYYADWQIKRTIETLYVNKRAFDGLPANVQNAMVSTAKEIEAEMWKKIGGLREQDFKDMGAQGIAVHVVAPAELVRVADATAKVRDEWYEKEGPTGPRQEMKKAILKLRGQ